MEEDKKSRGKRLMSWAAFALIVLLTVGGFFNVEAWELAKAYLPYFLPFIAVLLGVDEHYRSQRVRNSLEQSGN